MTAKIHLATRRKPAQGPKVRLIHRQKIGGLGQIIGPRQAKHVLIAQRSLEPADARRITAMGRIAVGKGMAFLIGDLDHGLVLVCD